MAALELALVLLATVLASAVIDQLLPRLPLPLIQIACGVAVALFAQERITIESRVVPRVVHRAVAVQRSAPI